MRRHDAAPLTGLTIALDDGPGPEWLIAVFSREPLELAPLADQLRGQSKRATLELECGGCRVEQLRVQKGEPRP